MKLLPIRLALAILALAITGSSPAGKPATPPPHTTIDASPTATATGPLAPSQAMYYWFTYPDDSYNDYNSISNECYEMWLYYGVLINTNPAGGVLVDRGYISAVYPHNFLPSQFLFAHY